MHEPFFGPAAEFKKAAASSNGAENGIRHHAERSNGRSVLPFCSAA